MVSTDLLVGYTFVNGSDITATPTSAQWSATNFGIGSFTTTAPYSAADVPDSAAFVDSNVIAAILGKITISGVNPSTTAATTFGVAFRASAATTDPAAVGVVKINGDATALTAPEINGQFNYLGLAG
jgi:hypothetical protein